MEAVGLSIFTCLSTLLGGLVALKQGPPPGTKVIRKPAPEIAAGARVKEKGQ